MTTTSTLSPLIKGWAIVLGIGVNVNVLAPDLPQGIDPPATSLLLETGRELDRVELFVELLDRLERAYDGWVAATGT